MNSNQLNFIRKHTCKDFQNDIPLQYWFISRTPEHLQKILDYFKHTQQGNIWSKKKQSEYDFLKFLLR